MNTYKPSRFSKNIFKKFSFNLGRSVFANSELNNSREGEFDRIEFNNYEVEGLNNKSDLSKRKNFPMRDYEDKKKKKRDRLTIDLEADMFSFSKNKDTLY